MSKSPSSVTIKDSTSISITNVTVDSIPNAQKCDQETIPTKEAIHTPSKLALAVRAKKVQSGKRLAIKAKRITAPYRRPRLTAKELFGSSSDSSEDELI